MQANPTADGTAAANTTSKTQHVAAVIHQRPPGGDNPAYRLSKGAMDQLHYALLSELVSLLEGAIEPIAQLRDEGLEKSPLVVDARPHFDWIAQTVEALDALGWHAAIKRFYPDHSAAAPLQYEVVSRVVQDFKLDRSAVSGSLYDSLAALAGETEGES